MTRIRVGLSAVVVACAGLVVASPLDAHHSLSASYDANKPITLTGVLSKMAWTNPHGRMFLDVTGQDGKVVTWEIETNAVNVLYRRGWKQADLPVGIELVIEGFLARDGSAKATATNLTLPDGRRLLASEPGAGVGN